MGSGTLTDKLCKVSILKKIHRTAHNSKFIFVTFNFKKPLKSRGFRGFGADRVQVTRWGIQREGCCPHSPEAEAAAGHPTELQAPSVPAPTSPGGYPARGHRRERSMAGSGGGGAATSSLRQGIGNPQLGQKTPHTLSTQQQSCATINKNRNNTIQSIEQSQQQTSATAQL